MYIGIVVDCLSWLQRTTLFLKLHAANNVYIDRIIRHSLDHQCFLLVGESKDHGIMAAWSGDF